MWLTLLTVNRNALGATGWVILLWMTEVALTPSSRVPRDMGDAISRGCGYIEDHLCILGGCYYKPRILRQGPIRPSLTRTIPTFIELEHRTGYFRYEVLNVTRAQSVECAVLHTPTHFPMEVLVSLIPALTLAGIIIMLLIFLRSANQPYVLTKNEVPPVDAVPMREFTIVDNNEDDDVPISQLPVVGPPSHDDNNKDDVPISQLPVVKPPSHEDTNDGEDDAQNAKVSKASTASESKKLEDM